jgi:protein-S-isoprenylcysteine O-methyltransferase Ste14
MLGMLLATVTAWTWWPMAVGSVIAFIAGTEIRVRAEERLLAEHFGESFSAYRERTSAYIPFVR